MPCTNTATAYKKAAYRATVYGPPPELKPVRATIYRDLPPAQTQYSKSQAFKRIHFCKELNTYVPSDYSFQVRGIRKEVVVEKQSLMQRFLNKQPEAAEEEPSVVVAKGLTHGKIHLVPLEVAQRDQRIRLHGIDGEAAPKQCTMAQETGGPKMLSLWEAQARRDIVYRSALAPRTVKKTKGKTVVRK